MRYIDFFIEHYGWQGAALAAVIIVLFAVQIHYYARTYARISRYRNDRRKRRTETDTPEISVIVPLFSENAEFLETGLLKLLAQEYRAFEIVVVYVGLDTDFYEDLVQMRLYYPNLHTTKIEAKPHFPISPKMAINLGIKAAHYEHIILTTPDASPRTDRWLTLMARGFTRGEIVLGYCGYSHRPGLANYIMRTERLMSSVEWIASAIRRRPYRGNRNNIGFTKSLYFGVNGFGNLNMNVGEDDLFIQQIATPENVSVVLSPRAAVVEKCWGGWKWWIDRQRYCGATRQFYPQGIRSYLVLEHGSRLLFFAAVATALAVMPLEYRLAAAVILLIRYAVVAWSVKRVADRLGERGIMARYPLFDVAGPIVSIFIDLLLIRKYPSAWR